MSTVVLEPPAAGGADAWVGLGCGNGVGFVVKCVGIHIGS